MKLYFKRNLLLICTAFLLTSGLYAQKRIYLDENAPIEARINDLLSILTPEEKISLLRATSPGIPRLGIKKYYHGNEALHGIVRPGPFTVFPQAIGLASMWNKDLLFEIATVISDEARARWNELERGDKQLGQFSDLLTFWSPTVNMARDPRWGRTPETYGEDPYLSGVLGTQFVKGLQGNHPKYLKVVSTPKHFAANNEEHNRFEANPQISERQLREYYLPAFEKCIIDGQAASIMTAYNALNDVPATVNTWLIKKVLRGDWGFGGYVVSDCGGPILLVNAHRYVKTKEAAATLAIKAGLDLECGDEVYIEPLLNAYKQEMVSIADIDSAAYHILRARMKLGLFDNPENNPYNKLSPSIVGSTKHKELALKAARQSIVLLKNQKNTLPLNANKIKSIAVVGINAANCEFGDYSGTPVGQPVSILQGIQNRVGTQVKVVHSPWVTSGDKLELISKLYFPNGLKAEYYDNQDLEGQAKVRTDEWINFEPANQAPDPFIPKPPVSIRWTGVLKPTITGNYKLGFATDDGCRLFIDGEQLIDSWHNRGVATDIVEIELQAEKEYMLKAEYYDNGGGASAKLYWEAPDVSNQRRTLFDDAKDAARSCDVTIAVMGINQTIEREGQDRYDLTLPKDQEEFIKEIYKVNPNTVVVLVAGSSLAINWINDNIPAIVNAWYPGEQGGTAVAEVLFGDYNPAGRLPLTYYKSLEQLAAFDDYDVTHGRTYQYFTDKPLYPFGYGLSYTRFAYSKLKIEDKGDMVSVNFTIKNAGNKDGDEVAQLYVKLPELGIEMPIKQLKGFERLTISKGKSTNVQMNIDKKELRYWDEKTSKFVTPTGKYVFMVGASSDDIRLQQEVDL